MDTQSRFLISNLVVTSSVFLGVKLAIFLLIMEVSR